jgi:hypothetical protein
VQSLTPSATAGVVNRIVAANSNGYIENTYYFSTDNSVASGVTNVMVKQGNDYLRSGTAAAVATFISGQSMNISGSATNAGFATNATFASSATNATYATSAGSATNASAATNATFASSATNATYATTAGNGVTATTGSPAYYGARAWVMFNGTGTVAIQASVNVTNITDNSTGNYTVNFTTAMPSPADYAAVLSAKRVNQTSNISGATSETYTTAVRTTSALGITVTDSSNGFVDSEVVSVVIFR